MHVAWYYYHYVRGTPVLKHACRVSLLLLADVTDPVSPCRCDDQLGHAHLDIDFRLANSFFAERTRLIMLGELGSGIH